LFGYHLLKQKSRIVIYHFSQSDIYYRSPFCVYNVEYIVRLSCL